MRLKVARLIALWTGARTWPRSPSPAGNNKKMAPLPGKPAPLCVRATDKEIKQTLSTLFPAWPGTISHILFQPLVPTPLASPLAGSDASLRGFKGLSLVLWNCFINFIYITRAFIHLLGNRKPDVPTPHPKSPHFFQLSVKLSHTQRSVICLPPPRSLRNRSGKTGSCASHQCDTIRLAERLITFTFQQFNYIL